MTVWREIPTQDTYPGLTELTRDGRTIASVGTGARVRQAIVEAMEAKGEYDEQRD